MHHYTHITSSPLYTNPTHTIERLSRSSWQITSHLLSSPITAKTYAEAKAIAAEIDWLALSTKRAELNAAIQSEIEASMGGMSMDDPGFVDAVFASVPAKRVDVAEVEANPFEAILTEAATITDLGNMQGAYDQAVRECDLCAVFGHLGFRAPTNAARDAVEVARATVHDYARVVELAGLLAGAPLLDHIKCESSSLAMGEDALADLIESLCDLPDAAGYIKRALMLWAVSADRLKGGASWVARLRLEGAALRHARERALVGVAQEVRKVEDGGLADMGGDRAREWGEVWDVAMSYDGGERAGLTMHDVSRLRLQYVGMVSDVMPSLLSPEPEHWIPLQDGRVLIVNWRAGECVAEAISAAVWMDDGGLSLMGSYVLGSGWVSGDRLGEEDVDGEALGVIIEAIARAGLAAIA